VAAGTDLVQWPGEWGRGAGFQFEAVKEAILDDGDKSWHGYYRIVTHCTKNLLLTAGPGKDGKGQITQEDQKSGTGRDAQLWRLEQLDDDGIYLIINKSSEHVVESIKQEASDGTHDSPQLKSYDYVSGRDDPPPGQMIKMGHSVDQG
jgi:hypothetical protein